MEKPERISQIYKKNSHLQWTATRCKLLTDFNIILQEKLPFNFRQHCRLANIHDGRIIIHTDNAHYASMLRYQNKLICEAISPHLPGPITQVDIKVRPSTQSHTQTVKKKHKLLYKIAVLINSTADDLEDGPLKQSLKKLAAHQTD